MIEIFRYGIPIILVYGGIDLHDPNVNQIVSKIKNNKHGLK